MDFLYDVFFEVLSEEGVWILILIASAFAVASFILLTMRVETSPRQGVVGEMEKNPQNKKKNKGEKKRKKEEESTPETEGHASEPKTSLAPDPEMTPPESFTPPEVVLPGSAPYKNVPLPVDEQLPKLTPERPPTLAEEPVARPVLDPFEVVSIPGPNATMPTTEQEPVPATDVAPISISVPDKVIPDGEAAIGMQMEGGITGVGTTKEHAEDDLEPESGQASENTDIFALFESVEEEDTALTEFAKDLDDVALSGLLTETEDLSKELKGILTKHGRRQ